MPEKTMLYNISPVGEFIMSFVIATTRDNVIVIDGGRPHIVIQPPGHGEKVPHCHCLLGGRNTAVRALDHEMPIGGQIVADRVVEVDEPAFECAERAGAGRHLGERIEIIHIAVGGGTRFCLVGIAVDAAIDGSALHYDRQVTGRDPPGFHLRKKCVEF